MYNTNDKAVFKGKVFLVILYTGIRIWHILILLWCIVNKQKINNKSKNWREIVVSRWDETN